MNASANREPPATEITALQSQIEQLQVYRRAMEAQDELIRALISMSQVATGRLMIKSMLRQAAKMTGQITAAQECSLFLFDESGKVSESLLARGPTMQEDKEILIGEVLDKGLAGWVVRHRHVGLIADTQKDDRWINLLNQPYQVRSALCVPLLRGKALLGLITLTHCEPNHFTPEIARVMELCSMPLALVFDNARFMGATMSSSTNRQTL
ncbi:MAG: GAF domain-containing protein [Chloroflexaceae bacterium]|nr:GAF domain-containing protein [Chloroflexaceae bacterium]